MGAALAVLLLLTGGCSVAQDHETRPHRNFRFVYEARPRDLPADAGEVRMWIPVPVDTPDQRIRNVEVTFELDGALAKEPLRDAAFVVDVGGVPLRCEQAPIGHGAGRSLCVTTRGKACRVVLSFDVTRYETKGGLAASPLEIREALQANRMVPLGGKSSGIANTLEDKGDPVATCRVLYDHVLDRMAYDKPEGGAWGRGDAEWACDSRFGNCTDFHSYFMALARTKGVPARFEMGFSVPAGTEREVEVGGYHCWAWFYAGDERGWVPVDISEADKNPERADYFFGTLDEHRVTMTGGRDLRLTPAPAVGTLNFFVYPHVEVDGKAWTALEKSFARTNLD